MTLLEVIRNCSQGCLTLQEPVFDAEPSLPTTTKEANRPSRNTAPTTASSCWWSTSGVNGGMLQVPQFGCRLAWHTHFSFIAPLTFSLPCIWHSKSKAMEEEINMSTFTEAEDILLPTSLFKRTIKQWLCFMVDQCHSTRRWHFITHCARLCHTQCCCVLGKEQCRVTESFILYR